MFGTTVLEVGLKKGFDHDSVQMLIDQILECERERVGECPLNPPLALSPSQPLESEKAVGTQP
jgi:hypothetical protein